MGRGGRQPSPNPGAPQYQRRSPGVPVTPTSAPSQYGGYPQEQMENDLEVADSRRPKPLYMSNPFMKAALVKGNFKTIVAQPRHCDPNEVRSCATVSL